MTCKQIAKLLSEKRDHGLPLSKRAIIHVHLALCVFCRRLDHHLRLIHMLSEAAGDTAGGSPLDTGAMNPGRLSQEAKARIKQSLIQHGY